MELCPHVLHERGTSLHDLVDSLLALGYQFEPIRKNSARLPQTSSDLERIIPDGGSINVIARATGPAAHRRLRSADVVKVAANS